MMVKRWRWLYAIVLAALGGLIGAQAWGQTPPPSQPQGPGQRPAMRGAARPVMGTITSVTGSSFVLTTWSNRTVTVQTTSATRVLSQQQGALTDLRSGDFVRIAATKGPNNSVVAVRVSDTPASVAAQRGDGGRSRGGMRSGLWGSRGNMVMISGALAASPTNGGVTVAMPAGPALAVSVPSSARISRTVSLPVSGLAVGTHVAVSGTPASSGGGLTATTIFVPAAESR